MDADNSSLGPTPSQTSQQTTSQQTLTGVSGTSSTGPSLDLVFIAKIENAKTVSSVLNTLQHQHGKKTEVVNVVIEDKGLKFTVEHARCYQGNTYLESELFQQYEFQSNRKEEFSVGLSALLDCINIYGILHASKTSLQIAYQAWGKPLCLMLETNNVITDCGIRTVDPLPLQRFAMKNSEILAKIIMRSEALHDALNELDWSSDYLSWEISPDPPHFRMTTQGTGALCQVDYPKDCEIFEDFKCTRAIKKEYKMKHIQPGLKSLALAKKTQVRINEVGLLALQHCISLEDSQFAFVDWTIVPLEHDEESE